MNNLISETFLKLAREDLCVGRRVETPVYVHIFMRMAVHWFLCGGSPSVEAEQE